MKEAINKLFDKLNGWVETLFMLIPNLVVAIIVGIALYFIAKLSRKGFLRLINRTSTNEAVSKLFSNLFSIAIGAIGLYLILNILDLSQAVTSLLAGAGLVGLAVGLAFQDPILNVISGIAMSVREPFNMGDIVETNGYFGNIKKITLRSTHLRTLSGEDVIIPNKMVLQNPVENYTLTRYRRLDLGVGVSYNDDLDKVEEVVKSTIKENITYDQSKDIEVFFSEFGDSSINFELRFWLDVSDQKNFLQTKSNTIKAIKKAFDKEGISIPFPIRTLEFDSPLKLNQFKPKNGSVHKNGQKESPHSSN